ncbi:class I SAM-dependent methyltransferase [Moraxella sp. FZLJ2107]|uniref:class I SAM-dependent methyltransferase n=1 Tax=unclassified Moraxella TaxID=2685852 RepID=UPI0020C85248|nr:MULTISPECIES: methyltransferase [unclassified Moraxella]UTO04368.1 class I SAM-dependent methyltransferase [Moraxella sp. FZLJ2107]UTO23201.1 class I SAM-dependent methyltransferase [Moraxella sp. FZLJ2109]
MHQIDPDLLTKSKHWRDDITFRQEVLGKPFDFTSTWGIFSPEKLDDGSLMLLDYIDFQADDNSIDLGCGYGVLGMTAARECPNGQHLLIDKDFVAVEYAKLNCQKNGLNNAEVMLSNGFYHVDKNRKFSLVMSNLPAKASKEQHYLYLLDAYNAMETGARFYVVTINGLRDFMKRSFTEVFGNSDKIKQGKTYTITMAVKE